MKNKSVNINTNKDIGIGGAQGICAPQFKTNLYVKCPFSVYTVPIFVRKGTLECMHPHFFNASYAPEYKHTPKHTNTHINITYMHTTYYF